MKTVPYLTVVGNTEELRQSIAAKTTKRRRDRPRRSETPKKSAPENTGGIIGQCVIYAQSVAAYHAGFTVDHTGDCDFAGSDALGAEYMEKASSALRRLAGLSPAFTEGKPPLTHDELLAKAGVLGIMGMDSANTQPRDIACFIRFFAIEVEQYLRAQGVQS